MGWHKNGDEWHPIIASHGEQKCIKCRCKVSYTWFFFCCRYVTCQTLFVANQIYPLNWGGKATCSKLIKINMLFATTTDYLLTTRNENPAKHKTTIASADYLHFIIQGKRDFFHSLRYVTKLVWHTRERHFIVNKALRIRSRNIFNEWTLWCHRHLYAIINDKIKYNFCETKKRDLNTHIWWYFKNFFHITWLFMLFFSKELWLHKLNAFNNDEKYIKKKKLYENVIKITSFAQSRLHKKKKKKKKNL